MSPDGGCPTCSAAVTGDLRSCLRLLKEELHATGREGGTRLITILGSPGVGKSRLVWQ